MGGRDEPCREADGPVAGAEHEELETGTWRCASSRLFRVSYEIGQSMAQLDEAVLCAEGRLPVLLPGRQQSQCFW